ncbi:unnamed protein product [Trifolium pratense]|uniref:Uncharacterized protein n=1 Tax=Trifolium pratense TaxID=57577 RepID=A0ACB0JX29_TRIPR|nr:unnamed protein product [Trifolium pratense]
MQHPTPFRFFKAWTSHEDCERVVKEERNKQVVGNPMAYLQTKLKRLKVALRAWNKEVFGNIDANVKLAMNEAPFRSLISDVPIFVGKPKAIQFQAMAGRIKVKLATWKGSLLSIMGRVQLVRSVIHGMLVSSFHVYRWSKNMLKKICTVTWKTVCTPYEVGGLDLRPLSKINESLMLLLCWKMLSRNDHGLFSVAILRMFNLVRGSVLASSGSSPLPIAVAGDRTVVLPTKFSVNHH